MTLSERLADWERRFRQEIEHLWFDLEEADHPIEGKRLRDRVDRAADLFLEIDSDPTDPDSLPTPQHKV